MKLLFVFTNIIFGICLVSCTKSSDKMTRTQKMGDDFIVSRVATSNFNSTMHITLTDPENLQACRENISKIVCWVDPVIDSDDIDGRNRPCLSGGEKFASSFEGHFDRSPDLIKKMYCHLDKLWVEKSFIGTAYANPLVDAQDHVVIGAVGVRQEVLETPLTFDDWLSWKEETSFGGSPLTSDPRLGILAYKSNLASKEFFLDNLMNHEFGHLFDFTNHLNQTTKCEYQETSPGHWEPINECVPLPGSWGSLTWKNADTPKPEFDFSYRSAVCFYFCEGKFIDTANAVALFKGLLESGFPSIYSSRYPTEDFAEAFALTLAHEQFGLKYGITVQGQFFDLTAHFYSEKIGQKREYVQNFLNGLILYPGD